MRTLRMAFAAIACSIILSGCISDLFCKREPHNIRVTEGNPITFSGTVISNFGKPVAGAIVEVNGKERKTDAKGVFSVPARIAGSYIVTIRKDGYGLFSQTFQTGVESKTWVLTEATIKRLDPTQVMRVHDELSQKGCYGTLSSRVDSERQMPVYGGITKAAQLVLDIISNRTECSPGITVDIPANSLVDEHDRPPTGSVDISVATLDLFAPDGMPGNYGVTLPGETGQGPPRRAGYMESRGAGFITVTSEGKPFQLKEGVKATVTIPIDPTQLKLIKAQGGTPADTIPLLLYDEKQAVWVPQGLANLNATKDAYVSKISHFSGYNADLTFSNIGCVTIDTSRMSGNFQWEVSALVPGNGIQYKAQSSTNPIVPDSSTMLHAEYRLPAGQDITFRWFQGAIIPADPHQPIQGVTPLGQQTWPNLQTQPDQNNPFPGFPYTGCQGPVVFYKDASQAGVPIINASPTSTGSIAVSWTYDYNGVTNVGWDPTITTNSNDGYVLQESFNNGAFQDVTAGITFGTNSTDRNRSKNVMLTKGVGTYQYRVKACYAANPGPNQCTTYGVSGMTTITPPARLKIQNNLVARSIAGTYPDVHVLRVRIASISTSSTFMSGNPAEKLELDTICNTTVSKEVAARQNSGSPIVEKPFDLTGLAPNYFVYIELGYWKQVNGTTAEPLVDNVHYLAGKQCASTNAWSKHMFGTDNLSTGWDTYSHRSFGPASGYIQITGHSSGDVILRIDGTPSMPSITAMMVGGTGSVSPPSPIGINTLSDYAIDPVTNTIP
jgi:hypothetical protein